MNGLLSNPFLAIGQGLLSASGPSLNPGDVSLGRGMGGALNNLSAMQQQQFQRQLLAEKLRMQREEQSMKRREWQAQQTAMQREQEGLRGLLEQAKAAGNPNVPLAEGLIGAGRVKEGVGLLLPQKEASQPSSVQEYQFAQQQGFAGSYQDWVQAKAEAGRSQTNVTTNVAGDPYKPQTAPGKIAADIAHWEAQPPSAIRDSTLEALRREQRSAGTSAEGQQKLDKMAAVGRLAREFNKIAAENPDEVGPVAGTITRLKTSDGMMGRIARTLSNPNAAESELAATEAQMKALLGTALSGAAIPETEWPTYQAQIPSVTDGPDQRVAKVVAYGRMISALNDVANGKLTPEQAKQVAGLGQSNVPFAPVAPAAPGQPAPKGDVIQWGDLPD